MIRPPYRGATQNFTTNEAYEREQVRLETAPTVDDLPALRDLHRRIEGDINYLDRYWLPRVERGESAEPFMADYRRSMDLRPHEARLSRHIYNLGGGHARARQLARLTRVIIDAEEEKRREMERLPEGQSSAATQRLSDVIENTHRIMDALDGGGDNSAQRAAREGRMVPPAPAQSRHSPSLGFFSGEVERTGWRPSDLPRMRLCLDHMVETIFDAEEAMRVGGDDKSLRENLDTLREHMVTLCEDIDQVERSLPRPSSTAAAPSPPAPQARRGTDRDPLAGFRGIFGPRPQRPSGR